MPRGGKMLVAEYKHCPIHHGDTNSIMLMSKANLFPLEPTPQSVLEPFLERLAKPDRFRFLLLGLRS